MKKRLDLGDEVKDSLSKFRGIITSVHIYLHGCIRMGVTTTDKKPETKTFDNPQLVLIKKKIAKKGNNKIGGPNKYVDEGRL